VLQKDFWKEYGYPTDDLADVLKHCFDREEREMQYFALDILMKQIKKQEASFLAVLEQLVLTRSWWDSVDYLFSIIGKFFLVHPHLVPKIPNRWIAHENFWLNRVLADGHYGNTPNGIPKV